MDNLTYQEATMIAWFWENRGDPSRYVGWDDIVAKCPELKQAYEKWEEAEKELDRVIQNLGKS